MKSDNDMQHDIRNELVQMLSGNAGKLDVQVLEGVVTLTGNVNSDLQRWNVEDAIRRMPGVRGFIDETLVVALEAPLRSADADTARPWFPSS